MASDPNDLRLAEVIHLLDPPKESPLWFGGASPVGSLRGVTASEALWKPIPGTRCIWELTLHTAYWIYAVRRALDGSPRGSFPRTPSNFPSIPEPADEAAWKKDRRLLKSEYEAFLRAARSLSPESLDEPASGKRKYRYIDLLFGVVQHNTHHTGQIQLLKRMHKAAAD